MRNECNSCKELQSFTRFYCGAVNYGDPAKKGRSREELSKDNDCLYYKRTWWKRWIPKVIRGICCFLLKQVCAAYDVDRVTTFVETLTTPKEKG